MKFSVKDFFSKCDQIRRKLRIWSHFLCSVSGITTCLFLENDELEFQNSFEKR